MKAYSKRSNNLVNSNFDIWLNGDVRLNLLEKINEKVNAIIFKLKNVSFILPPVKIAMSKLFLVKYFSLNLKTHVYL